MSTHGNTTTSEGRLLHTAVGGLLYQENVFHGMEYISDDKVPGAGSRSCGTTVPSSTEHHVHLRPAREEVSRCPPMVTPLLQRADYYIQQSVASSTKKMYSTGWNTFITFATLSAFSNVFGLSDVDRQKCIISFVTYCADTLGISHATIKSYLCAIKFHFCSKGYTNPFSFQGGQPFVQLQMVLKGIKRVQIPRVQVRLPITVPMLQSMVSLLNKGLFGPYQDNMLIAVFLTAFFGFLRCGEFTTPTELFDPSIHLTLAHVSVTHVPTMYMEVFLSSSKTDPFRRGVKIKLFALGNSLCPVKAILKYLKLRYPLNSSPTSPFFLLPSMVPLTRSTFTSMFQGVLQCVGLQDAHLKPHSFRIGAATAAAAAHVPEHLIKTLGRWSSDSYLRYIRTPPSLLAQAQSAIGQVATSSSWGN